VSYVLNTACIHTPSRCNGGGYDGCACGRYPKERLVSYLLDAVTEAREHRAHAEDEYVRAVQRAREHHSLRAIAQAAGVTHNAIVHLLKREENRKP
jgi:hypothetical protein